MSLFQLPPGDQVLRRGHHLVRTAEACLERGQIEALAGVIESLRRLEADYGLAAILGPAPSWRDRYDTAIQAWKESR